MGGPIMVIDLVIYSAFALAVYLRIYSTYTTSMTKLACFIFYPLWITHYIGTKLSQLVSSVTFSKLAPKSCRKCVLKVRVYRKICVRKALTNMGVQIVVVIIEKIINGILIQLYLIVLVILWIPLFVVVFYIGYWATKSRIFCFLMKAWGLLPGLRYYIAVWTFILFVYP